MSVLVVFLSWPSLLWLCWSLSYSVYSATVGPFGICAGLVLLGEPDQSWPDVDHIWMCSIYMLKPLCPFFAMVMPIYMQILLASIAQFHPGKMKCLHARSSQESTNLCVNIGGKKSVTEPWRDTEGSVLRNILQWIIELDTCLVLYARNSRERVGRPAICHLTWRRYHPWSGSFSPQLK